MPIAYDVSARTGTAWTTGAAGLGWSHTMASATHGALVVLIGMYSAAVRTVTGITYNGVALTKVDAQAATLESNNQNFEMWVLLDPPSGTHTIDAVFSGAVDYSIGFSSSFTDSTALAIGAVAKATSATLAASAPTCQANVTHAAAWLVGGAYSRDTSLTTSAGRAESVGTGLGINDSAGTVSTGLQGLTYATIASVAWPAVIVAELYEGAAGPATPTSPTTTSITTTGATVGASTTLTSGTRYVVVTTSATPPALNGNGTGFVAGSYAYSSSATISGAGAFTYNATGLSPSTTYYHHHVVGVGGADSGVLTSSSFTTSTPVLSITTDPLVDEVGATRSSYSVGKAFAIRLSDNTLVKVWSSVTTNAGGVLVLSDAALTAAPHLLVTYDSSETPNNAGAKVYTPA